MKICWGWLGCHFLFLFFFWSPMISRQFKAREQGIKFKSLYIFLSQCIMSRVNDWVPLGISWKEDLQFNILVLFSSVQSLSRVPLFVTPWTAARQAYLPLTVFQSLLKLMFIEPVMPSNHLILFCPFSSCLQSFPASGSFPMSLHFASGGQCTGASISASVLPMNIQAWFPFRINSFYLFAVPGMLQSLLQHHNSKASVLQYWIFFMI